MSEQVEKNRSKKPILFIIILSILLIVLVIVGYLFLNTKSQVDGLIGEKEQIRVELQAELDALLDRHNQVKTEYGQLSDSLGAKDSVIMANAKEIKKLLNYKWEYYQIKKKITRLQKVAQVYVNQMDSLYTVNQELKEENQRIRESYRSEKKKNTELVEEKEVLEEIVGQAAVLRAYNINSTAIRQRGSRQKETDKANRTDRVRICFTIGENTLIEPGKKNIYLRIARPDDAILVYDKTDDYAFDFEGKKLQYSIKREIDFEGEAIDMCVYWDKRNAASEAMPGRYNVSLYTDNAKIGESSFLLK